MAKRDRRRAKRSLGLGAILVTALVACGTPPGRPFHATLSSPDGGYPLPVTLGDATGLVVGIGAASFDPVDFRDAGLLVDPSGADAFIVTWLGGACDNDTALAFRSSSSGYDLQLAVREKFGLGGCPALGILRGLRIETSQPIPVASITISGDRRIELVIDEDCGPLVTAATNDAKLACGALIGATIGDRTESVARVTVAPEDGACPGTQCSTAEGIAALAWRVDATDRDGQQHAWRCTYRDEAASCTAIAPPPSP